MPCERVPGDEVFPPELDALWSSALVRHIGRTAHGVRDAVRRHPVHLDVLLALLILTVGVASLLIDRAVHDTIAPARTSPLVLATIVGQALPLLWRRRAPTVVLAVVLACCLLQWSQSTVLRSSLSLLIALYSLARYGSIKRLPWAALGTAAGLAFAALRIEPFKQQQLTSLFVLYSVATAATATALVARVRLAQLSVVADRRARLAAEREQRERLATLTERARVSREMHDIIGHNLAVITGLADGAAAAADAERSAEVLRIIAATSRQALSELRRTLGAMRETAQPGEGEAADLAPQPSVADLAALLERTRAAGPRISYRTAGNHDAMAPGVQLTVYRIIQEALTNSLKYAGPDTRVQVGLRVTEAEQVEVSVRDSGPAEQQKFPKAQSHTGLGLLGIAERASLAGGIAEAGPTHDGGWLVRAVLPLSPSSSASGASHP